MRAFRWFGFVVLAGLLLAPGLTADEGAASSGASAAAERALEALKVRMEARIKEGELLGRAGRIEEALEAYRSVAQIYENGMRTVGDLVERLAAAGAARPAASARSRSTLRDAPVRPRPLPTAPVTDRTATGAVKRALRWLAAHQSPNGSWDADGFDRFCDGQPVLRHDQRVDGHGKNLYTPGVTGLAVAAFIGAAYTNQGKHPYATVVQKGLRYLKNIQDPEGCFGPRRTQQYIYNHACASLAMIEAYGVTGSPILKQSAQKALDFIAQARNPYLGWRYGVRPGDNDTSVTTWMIMCIKSAKLINEAARKRGRQAPLVIDEGAFDGAKAWIDKVTDPGYGRVGYVTRGSGPARPQDLVDRFPGEKSESMTAAGMLIRIFLGEDPRRSKPIRMGAELCSRLPPVWNPADGSIDMYYWYYGTLAMHRVGGKHWRTWSGALDAAVVKTQRLDTDPCLYQGSWDPIGPWGLDGGRVFSTALMCMVLEVQSRYDKVFGTK